MDFAVACAELATHIINLGLFVSIENPLASWLYRLTAYVRLHSATGFFYLRTEGCAFDMLHPTTTLLVKKAWLFLTNAPYLWPLGRRCSNLAQTDPAQHHEHSHIIGSDRQWDVGAQLTL